MKCKLPSCWLSQESHKIFSETLIKPIVVIHLCLVCSVFAFHFTSKLVKFRMSFFFSVSLVISLLLSHFSRVWLCDPIDCSPSGSPVPGILQARTLEWVAISFSNEWKWRVKVKSLSRVRLLVTPWTAAYQASLPMGFSRQEYWSGLPLPSPAHW